MQVVNSVQGLLRTLPDLRLACDWARDGATAPNRGVACGVPAVDALLPGGAFAGGAVHEVLDGGGSSLLMPGLLARTAGASTGGWIAWCDVSHNLYPPALAAMGVPLDRLLVLRPTSPAEAVWAMTECLRCSGIALAVAPVGWMSRVHARRLQLAAERGGGLGVLLRPTEATGWPYAAASRWLVTPAGGARTVHRLNLQLLHGHGGRIGHTLVLEVCRETHHVRALDPLVARPPQPKTAWASA